MSQDLEWPHSGTFRQTTLTIKERGEKPIEIPGLVEAKFDDSGQQSLVPYVGPVCPYAVYQINLPNGGFGYITIFDQCGMLRAQIDIGKESDWFSARSFGEMETVLPFYEWIENFVRQSRKVNGYEVRISGTKFLHSKPPPYVFLD